MNTYGCYYLNKNIEVYSETSYGAQQEAQKQFQKIFPRRKVKGYDIAIILEERNGEQVVHKPLF